MGRKAPLFGLYHGGLVQTCVMEKEEMKRPLKVLHLITGLSSGGVENMLYKVVTRYDRERFNPVVCCIKSGGAVAESLKAEGIGVIMMNRMRGHGFDWRAVLEIQRMLKQVSVDVLRTHQYHANLYGRIAGRLAGVPVIIPSFHNLYRSPDKPKMHRRLINRFLASWSDRLVAVSDAVADDIVRYDGIRRERIRVIHNGIVIEDFRPSIKKAKAREVFGLPEKRWIVGSVGRLTPQKGHEFMIKAVKGLKEVALAIAGDGPLRRRLKEVAHKEGVECYLLGTLDQKKIPLFLKALDIFCFPSLWEGMPSALLEAMASGLPVIATRISSNMEIVGNAGILVDTGAPEEIRDSIERLMGSEEMRKNYAEQASKKAERFSIENTVREYENLYLEVLKEKGLQ
ncbi:MAG TPA: glycosyltransferase [Nitrospirae bacterium]|nr:glycosyltransferase [Nitrospirota bacterium]